MRLKLDTIAGTPGGVIPFEGEIDLGDIVFPSGKPFRAPVRIRGEAANEAGVLKLRFTADAELHLRCDRCADDLVRPLDLRVERICAEALENPEDIENADVLLLADGALDLGEILRDEVLLEAPATVLCGEDCPGLCPRCGKNLKDGPCACEKEIDPRLLKLRDFFSDNDE